MKINFLARQKNLNMGSYRIWINDINEYIEEYFNKAEVSSKICFSFDEIDDDCDMIILSKSLYRSASEVKKVHPSKKIGAINVDCDYFNKDIDFVIVGSIEEYTSLSSYENVFIVDLIEKKFSKSKRKKHIEKNDLIIGYHGHHPHLFKFFPFLKEAIEKLDKEIDLTLKVIIGDKNFNWQIGKPDIKNIEIMYYEDIDVEEEIKTFDVGVVPNVSDLRVFSEFAPVATIKNLELGVNTTDYFMRFKNKTNPGRAYVFYQLGIPVIHDLSPSSFALMQYTNKFSCAHDSKSWYKELKKMTNHALREDHAAAYYEAFYKLFDNEKRMVSLINSLKTICT